MRHSVSFLTIAFLAACQPQPKVATPEAAIGIGWKVCDDFWGKFVRKVGRKSEPFQPEMWRARLDGDHWHVWMGSGTVETIQVDVPLDGRPLDPETACRIIFP
jgi:hypothetical protein